MKEFDYSQVKHYKLYNFIKTIFRPLVKFVFKMQFKIIFSFHMKIFRPKAHDT